MADDKNAKDGGARNYELGRLHAVDPRLGRLHEARNVATGTPALTLVPSRDVEWQPGGPCRMSLTYEPEGDSVTVDVERAPASVCASELANLIALILAVFRRVEDDGAVNAHLASGPVRRLDSGSARGRGVWNSRMRMATAGLAGFAVSLGLWFSSRLVTPRSEVNDCSWAIEDALRRETDFLGRSKPGPQAVAYPLPEKPWTKQAVAPCEPNNGEVEINKGCWVELAEKLPCSNNHAEYQGKCYMPVRKPEPVPQSAKP